MVRFQVTENCINNGSIISADNCPISLAIREKFPNAQVTVGQRGITFGDQTFSLPRSVENFVALYDANMPVKPFSFVLPV